ncbi:MAG: protein translocase subunit SecD [Ignavibacteriaceae bacterium]|nr:protein translocase subunit SecD [Ignavibacteriaceae bacterium]
MKLFDYRLVLTVLFTVLSIYLLYPTFEDYQNTKKVSRVVTEKKNAIKSQNKEISEDQLEKLVLALEDSIKLADPSIRDARLKRIKLGLDLQGGMRIVLEVNTAKLVEKLAQNPDEEFKEIMKAAEAQAATSDEPIVDIIVSKIREKGIRLSRYFGTIRQEDDQIISELTQQTEDAVSRAIQIIRNRIDQYGVSEPSIQKQGDRRIVVELPGIAKEEEARQLIQGTALLEFKLLKDPEFTFNVMQRIDEVLAGKKLDDTTATDTTKAASDVASADTATKKDTANQQMSAEQFAKEHPFFSIALLDPQGRSAEAYVKASDKDKLLRILSRPDVQAVIPDNGEFLFSAKPVTFQEGEGIYLLYFVNRNPELTGGVITDALAQIDQNTSAPMVTMEMNADGAAEWARITGANVDKRCAIILDGVIFSAPVIRGKIPGGRSQIEGMENMEEAKLLEIVLKAGALPAPVDIIEERTVGPSLGQDSVSSGLNSMVLGYLLISIFMIFYYRMAGSLAAAGLTVTILFILGVLAGFKATLTLPGIAGIVLTMGMAVDANVLIYERIREELSTGKTIRAAVDIGFSKAYSAIIDSNLTTLITCIILYQFGSGPVQGFALTLMIGVLTSLFAALIFVRLIFDYMVFKGSKISLG